MIQTRELDFEYFNNLYAVANKPSDHVGDWSGLIRLTDWRTGKAGRILRASSGDMTGNIKYTSRGKKYWNIKICNTAYKAHRIIYLLTYGNISSEMQIDHINGDSLDNSIGNLRLVTNTVNRRNLKRYSNNTTGVNGVHYVVNASGIMYFVACWYEGEKRKTKSFPISRYENPDDALESARIYREDKILEINKQLGESGYTDRHGT
jgi:hypothetical protein